MPLRIFWRCCRYWRRRLLLVTVSRCSNVQYRLKISAIIVETDSIVLLVVPVFDLRRFTGIIEVSDLTDDLLGGIFFVVGFRRENLVDLTRAELQAELVLPALRLFEPRLDLAATGDWDLDHGLSWLSSRPQCTIEVNCTPVNVHLCMYTRQHVFCKKSENNFFGGLIAPIKSSNRYEILFFIVFINIKTSPKRHPLVRNCLHLVALTGAAQAIGLGQAGKPFTGSPDPRGRGVFGVSGK